MGKAQVMPIRIRLDRNRTVDLDDRLLEALIGFGTVLLKAENAEDELSAIGRTAEELREWLGHARERPGYGVPALLLRHLGTDVVDVEAATEALARPGDDQPIDVAPDPAPEVVRGDEEQAALIPPADPVEEGGGVDLPRAGRTDEEAGPEEGKDRPEPLMHIAVRGQTVAVDRPMLKALVGYVKELVRSRTPKEIEREVGREVEELQAWVEIAEERSGMPIPRALLRHIGTNLADIEAATMELRAKPDALEEGEGSTQAADEATGVEGVPGAGYADEEAREGAVGEVDSPEADRTEAPAEMREDVGEVAELAGRDPPPRIVRVEPLEREVEWFGEETEFAMRRWRYLRADWLRRWDSGEKETSDGLLMREHMLSVELDLIENHKMTLTSGLPWVAESLEWDELTRQEQASWRRRELADVREMRAAVDRRANRWKRVRRLAGWPVWFVRQRGG